MENENDVVCECGSREFKELGWLGNNQNLRCIKCGLDRTITFSLEESTIDLDDLSAEEIIEKQGWNEDSVLMFHNLFLGEKSLHQEFEEFLRKKAKEENGET